MAAYAVEIQTTSRKIFDRAAESPKLRALCLQFLSLDSAQVLSDVKRVYARATSSGLRFAIEKAFLAISDTLYESLNPPGGPATSRITVALQNGCKKPRSGEVVFLADYWAERSLIRQGVFPMPRPAVTNLRTRQHLALQDVRQNGGWQGGEDGQFEFDLAKVPNIPPGDYMLALEYASGDKILSTGYGAKVSIRETPRGKVLTVDKTASRQATRAPW